jgi:hypothetical protein
MVCVVHPPEKSLGFAPRVAQHPVRSLPPRYPISERPMNPEYPFQLASDPFEKWTARRNQSHVQTLVDVPRTPRSVMSPSPSTQPRKKSAKYSSGISIGPRVRLFAGDRPIL